MDTFVFKIRELWILDFVLKFLNTRLELSQNGNVSSCFCSFVLNPPFSVEMTIRSTMRQGVLMSVVLLDGYLVLQLSGGLVSANTRTVWLFVAIGQVPCTHRPELFNKKKNLVYFTLMCRKTHLHQHAHLILMLKF